MGTILGSSTLFSCMQLYRQHVVERANEASTIADIETIIVSVIHANRRHRSMSMLPLIDETIEHSGHFR